MLRKCFIIEGSSHFQKWNWLQFLYYSKNTWLLCSLENVSYLSLFLALKSADLKNNDLIGYRETGPLYEYFDY